MATLQQELGPVSSPCEQPFPAGMSPAHLAGRAVLGCAPSLPCQMGGQRGFSTRGQGARSEENTFLGLHLLAKPGNIAEPPLRAAACREPGPAGQRGGCRGMQGCRGHTGGTAILFEEQVGEIHTAFNQAASFRL